MKYIVTLLLCFLQLSLSAQKKVSVTIHNMSGYEGYEEFARQAASRLEKVLNSEKFRMALMAADLKKTNGMSNKGVYNTLMEAHEVHGPGGRDGVIDLRVRTINEAQDGRRWVRNCDAGSGSGIIAIDDRVDGVAAICPHSLSTWVNSMDYASLAAHYMHEYLHHLGFTHGGKNKTSSAVYQISSIVQILMNEDV